MDRRGHAAGWRLGLPRAARPGYDELRRLVAAGAVDVVLTVDQDRLSRADPIELEQIIALCRAHGVRWATTGTELDLDNPDAVFMARMQGNIARREIDMMRKRQRQTFDRLASEGRKAGGGQRPFGFRPTQEANDKGKPVTVFKEHEPAEAEAIRDGAEMIRRGGSLADVMKLWNERGLSTPQAGQVRKGRPAVAPEFKHPSTVRSVLVNPRNIGHLVVGGVLVNEHAWAPILDVETYERVRAIIDGHKTPVRGKPSLLGGREAAGRCVCGNTLGHTVDSDHRGNFRCDPKTRGDRPGPHVWTAPADLVEQIAVEFALERLSRPDVAGLIREEQPRVDVAGLSDRAAKLRRAKLAAAEMFAEGDMDKAEYLAARAKSDKMLAEIDAQLAVTATTSPLAPFAAGKRAAEVWDGLSNRQRRAVLAELLTVTLQPTVKGKKWTDGLMEVAPRGAS